MISRMLNFQVYRKEKKKRFRITRYHRWERAGRRRSLSTLRFFGTERNKRDPCLFSMSYHKKGGEGGGEFSVIACRREAVVPRGRIASRPSKPLCRTGKKGAPIPPRPTNIESQQCRCRAITDRGMSDKGVSKENARALTPRGDVPKPPALAGCMEQQSSVSVKKKEKRGCASSRHLGEAFTGALPERLSPARRPTLY